MKELLNRLLLWLGFVPAYEFWRSEARARGLEADVNRQREHIAANAMKLLHLRNALAAVQEETFTKPPKVAVAQIRHIVHRATGLDPKRRPYE